MKPPFPSHSPPVTPSIPRRGGDDHHDDNGSGGDPWSWFNDLFCGGGSAGGGDCYRYETFLALPVLGTTGPRRVGFDLDPSIGQFRAYLVVAADISQP